MATRDELAVLDPRVIVCLGGIAWKAVLAALATLGHEIPRPRPRFAHGGECAVDATVLVGSYHVSQQNTFTGRLTPPMLDDVLERAASLSRKAPR